MRARRGPMAVLLGLAVAAGLARGQLGEMIIEQNEELVPANIVERCTSVGGRHCNDFIISRSCFFDKETRQPSLNISAPLGTTFVAIVVDPNDPGFDPTRAALCGVRGFEQFYNPANLTVEPLFILNDRTPEAIAEGTLCLKLATSSVYTIIGPHHEEGVVPALSMSKVLNMANFASLSSNVDFDNHEGLNGFPLALRVGPGNKHGVKQLIKFAGTVGVTRYALVVVGVPTFQDAIIEGAEEAEVEFGVRMLMNYRLDVDVSGNNTDINSAARNTLLAIKNSPFRAVVYIVDPAYMRVDNRIPIIAAELEMFNGEYQWFNHIAAQFFPSVAQVNGIFYTSLTTDTASPHVDFMRNCLRDTTDPYLAGIVPMMRPFFIPESVVFDTAVASLLTLQAARDALVREITGENFKALVRDVDFPGLSGHVSFSDDLSREGVIVNVMNTGRGLVGRFEGGDLTMTVPKSQLVYAGNTSTLPPDFAFDCSIDNAFTLEISDCQPRRTVSFEFSSIDAQRYCEPRESYQIPCDYIELADNIPAIVLVAIGLIITGSFIVLMMVMWRHPMIRSGQREWLFATCIGSALCQVAFPTVMVGMPTVEKCMAQQIALSIGAVLIIGSLLVKLWRISRLLTKSRFRRQRITNARLLRYMCVLVGLDAGILALSLVFDPIKVVLEPVFTANGDQVLNLVCAQENDWPNYVLTGYVAGLALLACFSANEVRHFPSALSEGPLVFMAVTNATMFGSIVWIVTSLSDSSNIRANATAIGLLMCCSGTLCFIMINRFYAIFTLPADTDWTAYILGDYNNSSSDDQTSSSDSRSRMFTRPKTAPKTGQSSAHSSMFYEENPSTITSDAASLVIVLGSRRHRLHS